MIIRDCDPMKRELIPSVWEVVHCKGEDGRDLVTTHKSEDEALQEYQRILGEIKTIPCSNVRLYVGDKEGYRNCLMSDCINVNMVQRTLKRMQKEVS